MIKKYVRIIDYKSSVKDVGFEPNSCGNTNTAINLF